MIPLGRRHAPLGVVWLISLLIIIRLAFSGGDGSRPAIGIILMLTTLVTVYMLNRQNGLSDISVDTEMSELGRLRFEMTEERLKQKVAEIQTVDKKFKPELFVAQAQDVYRKVQGAAALGEWESLQGIVANSLWKQWQGQALSNLEINRGISSAIDPQGGRIVSLESRSDEDLATVRVEFGDEDRLGKLYMNFYRESGAEGQAGSRCRSCGAPRVSPDATKCGYCNLAYEMKGKRTRAPWLLSEITSSSSWHVPEIFGNENINGVDVDSSPKG